MKPAGAPILLSDSLTITRGRQKRFNVSNLRPRTRVPFLIDSVRIQAVAGEGGAPAGAGGDLSFRGLIALSFNLGERVPLTNGFVPQWLLSPARQATVEFGGFVHWVFSRPLYVPSTMPLFADVILNANYASAASITVNIAYAGRILDRDTKAPVTVDVPFVSGWDSTSNLVGQQNPGNNDLWNPLQTPVCVQGLVGRIQALNGSADGDDTTTVQLWSPGGTEITRGPVQWRDAFPRLTTMLPWSGVLQPGDYFQARLQTALSAAYRPMLSYVGYRPVVLGG